MLRNIIKYTLTIPIGIIIASVVLASEIEGTVSRRGSQEQIAGVAVRLLGTNLTAFTDRDGQFKIESVTAGTYQLAFSRFRYRTRVINVTVEENQVKTVETRLERIEFIFDEVITTGKRLTESVSRQSLTGLEIKRIPGTGGDALRAIQALPGIKAGVDFGGQLYVRGGSPEDNTIYFDRYPLANAYHFGGLVSTVSSEILQRIDIYAGGFDA